MHTHFRSALPLFFTVFILATAPLGHAQTSISIISSENNSHIEQALIRRGSVDFEQMPLREVVAELSRQFHVQMVISQKKLEEGSVSSDTPITKKLTDLSLESMLRLVLAELELTFTIRNEVLLITTPEDAESQLETRVYPVLDLLKAGRLREEPPRAGDALDYDSLIDLILATIQPDSWDDVGGPGAIDALENAASLVISQTRDVHRGIEGLLAALRRAKSIQGIAAPANQSGSRSSVPARHVSAVNRVATEAEAWQLPRIHAAEK